MEDFTTDVCAFVGLTDATAAAAFWDDFILAFATERDRAVQTHVDKKRQEQPADVHRTVARWFTEDTDVDGHATLDRLMWVLKVGVPEQDLSSALGDPQAVGTLQDVNGAKHPMISGGAVRLQRSDVAGAGQRDSGPHLVPMDAMESIGAEPGILGEPEPSDALHGVALDARDPALEEGLVRRWRHAGGREREKDEGCTRRAAYERE